MERANIERALRQCKGQVYGKDGAAALLGMKPTTLWSRLRSLGISLEKCVSRGFPPDSSLDQNARSANRPGCASPAESIKKMSPQGATAASRLGFGPG